MYPKLLWPAINWLEPHRLLVVQICWSIVYLHFTLQPHDHGKVNSAKWNAEALDWSMSACWRTEVAPPLAGRVPLPQPLSSLSLPEKATVSGPDVTEWTVSHAAAVPRAALLRSGRDRQTRQRPRTGQSAKSYEIVISSWRLADVRNAHYETLAAWWLLLWVILMLYATYFNI